MQIAHGISIVQDYCSFMIMIYDLCLQKAVKMTSISILYDVTPGSVNHL